MKRFKNILFVADFETQCSDSFARAVALAEHNQAVLTVVAIMAELPGDYQQKINGFSLADLNTPVRDKLQQQLDDLAASAKKNILIKTHILTGKTFLALIQEVIIKKMDLLIKTVAEEKFLDRLLGSSDMHLLRKCPCPVWLMKPYQQGKYQKILAAVDFDVFDPKAEDNTLNQQLMELSLSLALSEFSELHIVHAWQAYGESSLRSGFNQQPKASVDAYVEEIQVKHQQQLNDLVEAFINKAGKETAEYIKPQLHLIKGNAAHKIPELVKEQHIDLLMMGTVGRTGLSGFFMGNTSETILNQIDCSVLAVKPEGFISPVSIEE